MSIGVIGGIVGSALGLAGGLFGAYCSYKRAKGPRGRRFVVFGSLLLFSFIALFLALILLFPEYRPWISLVYTIILVTAIRYINRREITIQREEETHA